MFSGAALSESLVGNNSFENDILNNDLLNQGNTTDDLLTRTARISRLAYYHIKKEKLMNKEKRSIQKLMFIPLATGLCVGALMEMNSSPLIALPFLCATLWTSYHIVKRVVWLKIELQQAEVETEELFAATEQLISDLN